MSRVLRPPFHLPRDRSHHFLGSRPLLRGVQGVNIRCASLELHLAVRPFLVGSTRVTLSYSSPRTPFNVAGFPLRPFFPFLSASRLCPSRRSRARSIRVPPVYCLPRLAFSPDFARLWRLVVTSRCIIPSPHAPGFMVPKSLRRPCYFACSPLDLQLFSALWCLRDRFECSCPLVGRALSALHVYCRLASRFRFFSGMRHGVDRPASSCPTSLIILVVGFTACCHYSVSPSPS